MGWHKGRVCPHDPVRPVCTRASPTRSARRRRTPGAGRLRGGCGAWRACTQGPDAPRPNPHPLPYGSDPLTSLRLPPHPRSAGDRSAHPLSSLRGRKEQRIRNAPDEVSPLRTAVSRGATSSCGTGRGGGRWEEVRHVESLRPPLFAHLGGWTLRLSALRSGAGGITATWLVTRTAPWRSRELRRHETPGPGRAGRGRRAL